MTVIAMTREMGSRGRDVAVGLADRLKVPSRDVLEFG